jgi:phthalate 4,5-cis-dihydrodiol dehydrogenase
MARTLHLGVAGLGRAFTLMLPTFRGDSRVTLAAATDPRAEACAAFAAEFGGAVHASVEALCSDATVEAVYLATPHQFHAAHAIAALRAGKHVLVEKPLAISVEEGLAIAQAADSAGRHVIVGPSHGFDAPISRTRALIASGKYGRVRMVTMMNFTDFLYRPRRPEELDTRQGGGVVFSQAAHQVDIARLLCGGRATHVRAMTGAWDPSRPTQGAYSALMEFEGGAFATLTYSGYGHYDSDALMGGISELGRPKGGSSYGAARRALAAAGDSVSEAATKASRNYGGPAYREPTPEAPWHEHFGFIIVSCERADLRPGPQGIWIHDDETESFEPMDKPRVPRQEVIDELVAAGVHGHAPLHDARWGTATLEACEALLESARHQGDVPLRHQVAVDHRVARP